MHGREGVANEVTIGNTPPELTDVTLRPVASGQGETLAVDVSASDPDDDEISIQYRWTVNDIPSGNGQVLERPLKRNDAVSVEVIANDGRASGDPVVVSRTIANHPPRFVTHQNFDFSGSTYVYQAQATDADGDAVTFSLADQVEGMSIDRGTGRVVWNVPPGFSGDQPVTIVADDGHHGTESYSVTFSVR
jgi:hypothetical protein